jgi:hypothetical protein
MNIQLTTELRDALEQNPGEPLYIHDETSQKDYVIVERDTIPWDALNWLRDAVEVGLRDFEEGRVSPWDPEEIMRLAEERNARRTIGE